MARKTNEADERTALLGESAAQQPGIVDEPTETIAGATPNTADARLSRRALITFAICALTLFFVILGGSVMVPAASQIGEENICRQFHPDIANGTDPRCRDKQVQGELSLIDGVSVPLFLLPGILTAVPYGIFADTYGRRLGIGLSMLGLLLQAGASLMVYAFPGIFPMRAVWFASVLTFIGGGGAVLNAHIFAAISNVAPGPQKTLLFSYLGAVLTGAQLIGSPLAYLLMQRGAWLAIYVSFILLCLAGVLSVLVPDVRVESKTVDTSDSPSFQAVDLLKASFMRRKLAAACRKVQHIFRTQFIEQRTLGLLLSSLAFTMFGKAFTLTLAQYVRTRYGWTWAETGLLESLQGGIAMVTVSVFLPLLDTLLRLKWSWTLFEKDIFLAQLSLAMMAVGYFGIGVATTSAILLAFVSITSFSRGQEFIMRSLLAQAAGEANVGVVYTTNSVLETAGAAIAGPLMAGAFRQGMDWGGFMIGFPFFVASGFIIVSSVFVWTASKTAKVDLHHDDEE